MASIDMQLGFQVPLGGTGSFYISLGDAVLSRSIPALELEGGGHCSAQADFSFTLPMLSFTIEGTVSASGDANIVIPLPSLESAVTIDEVGNFNANIPRFRLEAIGEATIVGNAILSLPRLLIYTETKISCTGNLAASLPFMQLVASGTPGSVGNGDIVLPFYSLSADGVLSIEGQVAITLPLYKLLADVSADAYVNMAMNVKNYALTLFQNYDFNSFTRFNGVHLGAAAGKIVNLDSATGLDYGAEIDWNLRTPFMDMEVKTYKRLRQAWIGRKSTGEIIVTVVFPDGTEYEQVLENYEVTEEGIRVKFGKGLPTFRGVRSRYMALDFKNKDGSSIDLDVIRLNLDNYGQR